MGSVDRWYGQSVSEEQSVRFFAYYACTPLEERPAWATGLCLIHMGLECDAGYGLCWDFGLESDLRVLRRLRRGDDRTPFELYPDLWSRLCARRDRMRAFEWEFSIYTLIAEPVWITDEAEPSEPRRRVRRRRRALSSSPRPAPRAPSV